MSITQFLNPSLKGLPVYQPGRPIEEVAREYGIPAADIVKLASNENPLGPSPKAKEAMEQAIGEAHLYPDGNAFYLKRHLAKKLDVKPEQLLLGNGSNEIIEFIGHGFLQPGTNIVVSQYCFAIYPIIAKLFGADVVTVPAKEYGHDLTAMLAAVTSKTRVIFVANPNNPTGTLASAEAVWKLIESVPPDALLVMDEAYIEYLDEPVDLLPLIRSGQKPNLLLMRTFSKIYGLAGMRLGYGIGHPELIRALEKIRQPFNANRLVQIGAMAALDDDEHLDRSRRNNVEGCRYLERAFRELGLEFIPSSANFITVRVGDSQAVFEGLQRHGVIVRPMTGYGLEEWIRVGIGQPAENERCVAALEKVLKKREGGS